MKQLTDTPPNLELEPVGKLEFTKSEIDEALKLMGDEVRLHPKDIQKLQAVGSLVRGIGAYRTIQGEALLSRHRLTNFLYLILNTAETQHGGEKKDLKELLKVVPAVSMLQSRINESLRLAKDIAAAQTPGGARDPGAVPPSATPFAGGVVIGGEQKHVHYHNTPAPEKT